MINTKKENPVADHFNEDHSDNKLDYKINIVGQEGNKNRRLRLEEAWMLLLNTHYPNGLNTTCGNIKKLEEIIHLESIPSNTVLMENHHFWTKTTNLAFIEICKTAEEKTQYL